MTTVEKVAKAIHDEMDLTDSLALPEATRYARAAIEALRQDLPNILGKAFESQDGAYSLVVIWDREDGSMDVSSVTLDGAFSLEAAANHVIDAALSEDVTSQTSSGVSA